MICPNDQCGAGGIRQRGLSAQELDLLGQPEWGNSAQVCMDCGALYSFESPTEIVMRGPEKA